MLFLVNLSKLEFISSLNVKETFLSTVTSKIKGYGSFSNLLVMKFKFKN